MPALAAIIAARFPPALAFLEGIGAMEMVLVAVVGLLLFGGKGLPDMARTLGKAIREFKKATSHVENEVRRVMNEEPEPARRRPAPPPSPAATDSLPGRRPASATDGDEPADDVHGPEPLREEGPPPPVQPPESRPPEPRPPAAS